MLMLHAGAEAVMYDALRSLAVPEATATHVPIPHHRVVDVVRHTLAFYGHEVTEEHHGVTKDGNRYFGVLCLKSTYGNYTDMVGLRNSHDKSMPVGLAFGSRVFVCDNMAFSADHVVKRKHTVKAKHDLPALISEIIEPLAQEREKQHRMYQAYQGRRLSDGLADQAIMQMFRKGVVNVQRIPEVLEQWERPKHPEWGEKTAWRLFNAATYALAGKVAENPSSTKELHNIIDAVCVQ